MQQLRRVTGNQSFQTFSRLSHQASLQSRMSTHASRQDAKGTPRVAILDDYLDLAKAHFQSLPDPKPEITVFRDTLQGWTHAKTTPADHDALVQRLQPFDVICTMRERTHFPRPLLEQLPNLRLLLTTGTQHSTFDVPAASELGIMVATAPGKGRTDLPKSQRPDAERDITKGTGHPTTQHTWALILALSNGIASDDLNVKEGGWQTSLTTRLGGKTLGICGLGRLGAGTARVGILAWGMKVVCWSENLTQDKADAMAQKVGLPIEDETGRKTFQVVSKEELFSQSDVVSLHYVLSERSRGMVGNKELSIMKPSALLINTARGPLIDEVALLDNLRQGAIRGAAFDVHNIEPLPIESPWRSTEWGRNGSSRVVLSPHMGYVEEDVINTWYAETAENLERWLKGQDVLHRLN